MPDVRRRVGAGDRVGAGLARSSTGRRGLSTASTSASSAATAGAVVGVPAAVAWLRRLARRGHLRRVPASRSVDGSEPSHDAQPDVDQPDRGQQHDDRRPRARAGSRPADGLVGVPAATARGRAAATPGRLRGFWEQVGSDQGVRQAGRRPRDPRGRRAPRRRPRRPGDSPRPPRHRGRCGPPAVPSAAACLAASRQAWASAYAGEATATKTSLASIRPTTSFHQAVPWDSSWSSAGSWPRARTMLPSSAPTVPVPIGATDEDATHASPRNPVHKWSRSENVAVDLRRIAQPGGRFAIIWTPAWSPGTGSHALGSAHAIRRPRPRPRPAQRRDPDLGQRRAEATRRGDGLGLRLRLRARRRRSGRGCGSTTATRRSSSSTSTGSGRARPR